MAFRSSTPLPRSDYPGALDALLASAPDAAAHELFAATDDDFWFWLHTEGYRADARLARLLPGLPSETEQRNFTGTAGDETLRLAFEFYRLVHRVIGRHGRAPVASILEFGCGWGRILRFFTRDVPPERLSGIDCLPEAVALCQAADLGRHVTLVPPLPHTPLPSGAFDLVYAYSVFSHLSESAHLAWLAELRRLLRPDGLLIVTTRPRDFVSYCAHLRTLSDRPTWAGAAAAFVDVDACFARYDRGEYLHDPIGACSILVPALFGETCIPRDYVHRVWTEGYELLEYIADPAICEQNVIVVRRRG